MCVRCVIEVCGDQFRVNPIPLKTVRPFVMDDLILQETGLLPYKQTKTIYILV